MGGREGEGWGKGRVRTRPAVAVMLCGCLEAASCLATFVHVDSMREQRETLDCQRWAGGGSRVPIDDGLSGGRH